MTDYIIEAHRTLAGQFHGHKVTLAELRKRAADASAAGEALDKVKKALFYGKGDDIGLTASPGSVNCHEAIVSMSATDAEEVGGVTLRGAENLLHAALGKVTEATEFLDAVMQSINSGKPVDVVNLLEEIGDGFWYDAIALAVLGSNFENEQDRNIMKLRKRFPDRFTEHNAINRDLEAERSTLEQHGQEPATGGFKITEGDWQEQLAKAADGRPYQEQDT